MIQGSVASAVLPSRLAPPSCTGSLDIPVKQALGGAVPATVTVLGLSTPHCTTYADGFLVQV